MSGRRRVFVGVFAALFVGGCCWAQGSAPQSSGAQKSTAPSPPAQASITGTVTYVERMALPSDAAIEVRLSDVTTQMVAEKTAGTTVFAAAGKQVPLSFRLFYNPADINLAHAYQVQANIRINGKLIFTTTTAYPVITLGAPTDVAIVLQPANAPAASPAGDKLRDTHWNLVELNGKPAVPAPDGKEAHLELYKTGQISGSTGCNNITGNYIAATGGLQVTAGTTTMIACPPPQTAQEQAFFAALKATTAYRINGENLELLNGQQVLAKFQARAK